MAQRKKIEEIVEALFQALPVQATLPISNIAVKAGVSFETAKRYIELVMVIQRQPKVHEDRIGEQVGYRKQTRAGRPSKTGGI